MGWGHAAVIVIANAALIYKLKQDTTTLLNGWKDEVKKEMRDFHGRLCALEEKNKK